MTWFKLEGEWGGHIVHIHWRDGVWLCDDPTLGMWISGFAEHAEGHLISTLAGGTQYNHMKDPYSALAICTMYFPARKHPNYTGDVPLIPDPPEGAVY